MRVTRETAAAHREKIVETAGFLFRLHGYDGIGVADVMKRAGLTHGGFYGHFDSKDALAAEATRRTWANADWIQHLARKPKPTFRDLVRGYLSARHRDSPALGCPFAALGCEVPRQARRVRRAFTGGVRARVAAVAKLLRRGPEKRRRKVALAAMSGLVGALVLARAVDDARLSDEILSAAAAALERLDRP